MKTLIVPCTNTALLDGTHRLIATHPNGQMLFFHCLSGLDLSAFDRIVLAISKNDDLRFSLSNVISAEALRRGINLEICVLSELAAGPADAVYKTCVSMGITGAIVVKDSHSYAKCHNELRGNFVVGANVFKVKYEIANLTKKSFIVSNEQNLVLDITEKHLKSDVISVGVYGVEDVELFFEAFSALKEKTYDIQNIYMSHVVAFLTGMKRANFYLELTEDYESFATQEEWGFINRSKVTYLVDFNILYDSVSGCMDYSLLQKMHQISDSGSEMCVFTTPDLFAVCSSLMAKHGFCCLCFTKLSSKIVIDSKESLLSI